MGLKLNEALTPFYQYFKINCLRIRCISHLFPLSLIPLSHQCHYLSSLFLKCIQKPMMSACLSWDVRLKKPRPIQLSCLLGVFSFFLRSVFLSVFFFKLFYFHSFCVLSFFLFSSSNFSIFILSAFCLSFCFHLQTFLFSFFHFLIDILCDVQ